MTTIELLFRFIFNYIILMVIYHNLIDISLSTYVIYIVGAR